MTNSRRNTIILEAMLQIVDDAFIFCGGDEKIEFASDAVKHLFGYEPSELIGQPLEILIPAELRATHAKHIADFRQGTDDAKQMRDRKTIMGRCKDGSERPIRDSGSLFTLAKKCEARVGSADNGIADRQWYLRQDQ